MEDLAGAVLPDGPGSGVGAQGDREKPWEVRRRHRSAGCSYSGAVTAAEETCRSFVQMWAEAVMRQVDRVREARRKARSLGRAYERMEDWSPDDLDLARSFRAQWTEEQALVWAAHQVERWARRLAEERGEEPPPRDQVLADLRNALEHLDEAEFEGHHAVPGDRSRSLRALPGSRLLIATREDGFAFGLIDVSELESRALGVVGTVEDELMQEAADWWAEMSSGR